MSTMDAQTIQLYGFYAAVIQAIAALVFLGTVMYEAHIRRKLREQRRRDTIINLITNLLGSYSSWQHDA